MFAAGQTRIEDAGVIYAVMKYSDDNRARALVDLIGALHLAGCGESGFEIFP